MRKVKTIPVWKTLIPIMLFLFSENSFAQEVGHSETSLSYSYEDPELQWGSCPDFFPNGCQIAVLHGDPSKENADIFFKVPANTEIKEHWHTSAERMVLVSGEMEVTYQGEETRLLKKGAYAFGPAKKPHSARCGDQGPCVLFIGFKEPVDAFVVDKKE